MAEKLTKRKENYSQWYNELVVKADLAENSAVRGSMVIKPYGYSIWEKMQGALDKMFKELDTISVDTLKVQHLNKIVRFTVFQNKQKLVCVSSLFSKKQGL